MPSMPLALVHTLNPYDRIPVSRMQTPCTARLAPLASS